MKVGVLSSTSGSILAAIVEAGVPVSVVVVDRECGAIEVASRAGVPVEMVRRQSFGPDFDRDSYTDEVIAALQRHGVGLVAMAGFGTILAASMYEAFPRRVLNTHPALLPDFTGWHAVRDALAAGVAVTGCTVHLATEEVDSGPILAQAKVAIEPGETEESLHERIKAVERSLYPETILIYMEKLARPRRALLSVWDKDGIVDLARALTDLGFEIVSSGGTSATLSDAGIGHRSVEEVTGAAEMLSGRVKTLHPSIHGGILADRSNMSHLDDLARRDIVPIDLVVCNLYPFRRDPSVELIDIGGPAMVRAAAKNHEHVAVVVDPSDFGPVLDELSTSGEIALATRRRLARKAFAHTAAYDAAIVGWLDGLLDSGPLPDTVHLTLERAQDLRYGENPHQPGARYRNPEAATLWDSVVQRSGMELSYLNLFDADAAWRLVHEVASLGEGAYAAVIVKHANPCGVAVASSLAEAYVRAYECDPVSAFGGIVALAGEVSPDVADAIAASAQADVIVAYGYDDTALETLIARRKNTRILEAPPPEPMTLDLRKLGTGFLAQVRDTVALDSERWKVATAVAPNAAQWIDARLAWLVCARTVSNAIVVVKDGRAAGIGAGQQNRLDSARIALEKAGDAVTGSVAASDAFFPFRDTLDLLALSGVSLVVQPGGSVRDAEVIAAADQHGIAMVLTGERHFRH